MEAPLKKSQQAAIISVSDSWTALLFDPRTGRLIRRVG